MICVILAGGKGTRISNEYPDIPKAMIPILGKPVLEYEIEFLKHHGVNEIIIITGYLHSVIENYFKDGSSFGVKISYYQELSPLGTGGALFNIEFKEDFLLCAGDLIFNFSLDKMIDFHKSKNALATIFSHPSRHPFDSTLIKSNSESQVVDFFCINDSIDSFENNCSAGIYIISPKLLDLKRNKFQGNKCDLDKDILYETNRNLIDGFGIADLSCFGSGTNHPHLIAYAGRHFIYACQIRAKTDNDGWPCSDHWFFFRSTHPISICP